MYRVKLIKKDRTKACTFFLENLDLLVKEQNEFHSRNRIGLIEGLIVSLVVNVNARMAVFPAVNNLRAAIQKVIFVPIVYGFISLLPLFLSGWESSDRVVDKLLSTVRSKENMFDFVVGKRCIENIKLNLIIKTKMQLKITN